MKRWSIRGLFGAGLCILIVACRGREFAKPMPSFRGVAAEALIVFQSANEYPARGARIHLVNSATGEGSELDTSAPVAPKQILAERHLIYGAYLIGQSGQHALLSGEAGSANRHDFTYTSSLLSPGKKFFLRNLVGKVIIGKTDGMGAFTMKEDLADCNWLTTAEIVCLSGKYQDRREVVGYDILAHKRRLLYHSEGKARLDNLRFAPDMQVAAFTESTDDNTAIIEMDLPLGAHRRLSELRQRYVFGLAVSVDHIVAARTVKSKHEDDKLEPNDVWISAPYGDAKTPGLLLQLPALASPGFFSGKGFLGVESMAFSPDGQSLAVLMSGEDDCRMGDEGGNLACRKDIYIINRKQPGIRRLTQFQVQSAEKIQWLRYEP